MKMTEDGSRPRFKVGWAFTALPSIALGLVVYALAAGLLPLDHRIPWIPSLGLDLSFRVDGLSALMLLMITGVGTAVFLYAMGYLGQAKDAPRLFTLLSLFVIAMIGCVTADHLLLLLLFWEATSVLSFLLVGFKHEVQKNANSAKQALLVTGFGGLCLLAGTLLLTQEFGTGVISELLPKLARSEGSPTLHWAMALILVGAFTKSAQFPFHFWLPNAMAAPTPVSAYLHSATMVKLGVYLMARLDPGFGHLDAWQVTLKTIGSITAAWAMLLALRERDLKRILAFSTVATLGTLTMLVGLDGQGATIAVGALLLAHALYKAPLFFVAGNVDLGTGTRSIDRLGRLRHAMPWTATIALLAGASMAGLPLSFGYIAKDAIATAKGEAGSLIFAKGANAIFGAVAIAVAGVAAIRIFWRHPGVNETPNAKEGGALLILPPLALATIGIALGLYPPLVADLLAAAASAMGPGEVNSLNLSPEWGSTLSSLGITLAIGASVYAFWDPLHRGFERMSASIGHRGALTLYETIVRRVPNLAATVTRTLQCGRITLYTRIVVLAVTAALFAALFQGTIPWHTLSPKAAPAGTIGAVLLILIGALFACLVKGRFVLLLTAGLVGFGSALYFLFAGAPDVAFTQFTVETVFVIIAATTLLAIKRTRGTADSPEPRFRPYSLAIAFAFALGLTLTALCAIFGPLNTAVSDYFSAQSVPKAYGQNIVNVILVDFRALDTLGEASVVALALFAALAILYSVKKSGLRRESSE